jgi:hypothetical protein
MLRGSEGGFLIGKNIPSTCAKCYRSLFMTLDDNQTMFVITKMFLGINGHTCFSSLPPLFSEEC